MRVLRKQSSRAAETVRQRLGKVRIPGRGGPTRPGFGTQVSMWGGGGNIQEETEEDMCEDGHLNPKTAYQRQTTCHF